MNGNAFKYQEILNSSAKKICVIAGPGSGKTKGVLIPKAQQIISTHGVSPKDVLILSFSRLSAQDLKERVKEIGKIPRASTLHSLCLSFLLSEDNHDIRKRIETIVMDFEKQFIVADLKVLFSQIDKRKLRKMLDEFSAGWAINLHDEVFNEDNIQKDFKAAVLNWLDEHEAAMMEEIIYNAVDLAKKIHTEFIEKPQYIFIDEFQDLNKLEQEFIGLLGASSKLVMILGDPDQSIYSFKYAHPEGIKSLTQDNSVDSHTLEYSGRCGKKILSIANQLLKQADPSRAVLLKPLPNAEDGEVALVQKNNQTEEFSFVLNDIIKKVNNNVDLKEIIVLAPRKKLGLDFVKYTKEQQLPENPSFKLVSKGEYSEAEKERILLFGVVANPKSVLRIRSYIGLKDCNGYAKEFLELKQKYGNIRDVIQNANPEDFDEHKKRLKSVCSFLQEIRYFIERYKETEDVGIILDEIFPTNNAEWADIRNMLIGLREENDTIQTLFSKFIDHSRVLEMRGDVVRVMTLIASKGLDAEHVYIIGCNDGNVPGNNRSVYLPDYEYKQEQRRLLFVGVTRAKKSLTITWSRNIPYSQALGQNTSSVRTITQNGQKISQVGLSEFLQNIYFG